MAEQVAHTPGPWRVEEFEEGHIILMGTALTRRANHEVQHSIFYEHGLFRGDDEVAQSPQWAEAEANARLIASAPDMDAAGKTLAAYVYSTHNPGAIPEQVKSAMRVFAS